MTTKPPQKRQKEKPLPTAVPEKSSVNDGTIIKTQDLTHIYNEGSVFEKKALDQINLTIKAGEFIGLIGQTGSGKSTLIQHLNALLKPTSGHVFIDGEDIHADKRRLKKIRERVGLVFQYPEHQLFEVTVFKDVAFGPTNMGLPPSEVEMRVKDALSLVGLSEDIYDKSPFELSGGQKRRAAIAGVLAMQPDILILDEPTAGLDPGGRDEILSQIKQMHDKLHHTVIFVSHSMEEVSRLASRIIVLSRGRIIRDGKPAAVFSGAEELEALGLAVPQISALMSRLNQQGLRVSADLFTVEDAAEALSDLARDMGLTTV